MFRYQTYFLLSLLLLHTPLALSYKIRSHSSLSSQQTQISSNQKFLAIKTSDTPKETRRIDDFTILRRIPRNDLFFT